MNTKLERLEHRLNLLNQLRKDAMWRSDKAGADIASLTRQIANTEQEIIDESRRTQKERDKLLPIPVLAGDQSAQAFTATEGTDTRLRKEEGHPKEKEEKPSGTPIASSEQDDLAYCDCDLCRMRNDDRNKH